MKFSMTLECPMMFEKWFEVEDTLYVFHVVSILYWLLSPKMETILKENVPNVSDGDIFYDR